MNRRKLLKTAGVATLAAPFLTTGVYLQRSKAQAPGTKPLLIVFTGPFLFLMNADGNPNLIRVVAPPAGPTDPVAPHWPWIGTTYSEISLYSIGNTSLKLSMSFTPTGPRTVAGLNIFSLAQFSPVPSTLTPTPITSSPLFTLDVPTPDVMIGTNPTDICVGTCAADGSNEMECAAGAIFLYRNVDLSSVQLPVNGGIHNLDFHIDIDALPSATLGVYLSPCDCPNDGCHTHARAVVSRMQSLYPWIPTIDFFPPVIGCPPIAHGDDCQAPIMQL